MMRAISAALLALCLASVALAATVDFRVHAVRPRIIGQSLHLAGSVQLALTSQVEEALSNGIPLDVTIDIRLYRERNWLWDKKLESWRLRRQLYYHALSGQYLIGNDANSPREREGYGSLAEALQHMGSLDDVELTLKSPLNMDAEYRVGVRASLDIEALPPLLRPMAYTSRAWDLDSGWTLWKMPR